MATIRLNFDFDVVTRTLLYRAVTRTLRVLSREVLSREVRVLSREVRPGPVVLCVCLVNEGLI